jgi:hypothetical protein
MSGVATKRALLVGLVASLAAAPAAADVRSHVVIVGVNTSADEGVPPLSFADDDAARYFESLAPRAASLHVLSVLDPDTQRLFPDVAARARPPTSAELMRALADVFGEVERDRHAGHEADLVFIYVGHGAVGEDGEGYVSLLDGKFTREQLFDVVIAPSPARFNHVVVDACSAFHLLHRGKGAVSKVRRLLQRKSLTSYPNTGVLLATSADVETHEWSKVRGGVFSHEVISALSGAADVDSDGDLRYAEVGAFIEAANAGVKDRRAHIDFFIQPPQMHLERPITSAGRDPRVRLSKRDEGHFVVEDSRGIMVAEVHKNGEQPLGIGLVGEPPFRIVRDDDSWVTPSEPRGQLRLAKLERADAGDVLAARSAVTDALERGLFSQPFGKSYVLGYAARLEKDLEPVGDEPGPAVTTTGSPVLSTLGWTGVALGGALLIGGGAAAAFGAGALYSAETGRGELDAFAAQQLLDDANNAFLAAGALAGVGALVTASGAVFLFAGAPPE